MENTMNQTMTSTSTYPCTSGFGMPMSARGQHAAFGSSVVAPIPATGLTIAGTETRDRKDLAGKGHVSLDAVVPGNRAWSPPLC